jgi:hypothetical protein
MDKGHLGPNPNNPPHRTAAQREKTSHASYGKKPLHLLEADYAKPRPDRPKVKAKNQTRRPQGKSQAWTQNF